MFHRVSDMPSDDLFVVGKVYNSVDEVKSDISSYNDQHFTNFVVSTNNKRSLLIKCSHGRERKSESSGSRPKQHYNFLDCKASISFYKSQKAENTSVKITQVNLTHNHAVSKEIHDFQSTPLSEEEKQLVLTLKEANAKPSQIKRVLVEKKNKKLSTQRIKNLINKFLKTNNNDHEKQSLEDFLVKMDDDGADIDWISGTSAGWCSRMF